MHVDDKGKIGGHALLNRPKGGGEWGRGESAFMSRESKAAYDRRGSYFEACVNGQRKRERVRPVNVHDQSNAVKTIRASGERTRPIYAYDQRKGGVKTRLAF